MSSVSSVIARVTERVRDRSTQERTAYLERVRAAQSRQPQRSRHACANLAHGFAAAPDADKGMLFDLQPVPNVGIVSAYNDMLSAHQPLGEYPAMLKDEIRQAGAVAQFAGGVPAMCDGVTQGTPGMELSLFSRDVIAQATAIALTHNWGSSSASCSMPGSCMRMWAPSWAQDCVPTRANPGSITVCSPGARSRL